MAEPMNYRRVLASAGLLGAGLVIVAWYWALPVSPINKASYARLKLGMSLHQVKELLGGPARDESTGRILAHLAEEDLKKAKRLKYTTDDMAFLKANAFYDSEQDPPKVWKSNAALILVFFEEEKVSGTRFISVYQQDGGFWASFKRWVA